MSAPDIDKILADAAIAARYFRALLADKVVVDDALRLTSDYMIRRRIADMQPPREPWEDAP